MLTVRIIPCLDTRDGRVVKGVKFQNLRDAGDPAERATVYEAQGADEIVLLDVSATPDGRKTAVETVRRVRAALSIPLTVGGGVRSADDAGRLLDAGADKVGVNTAAVDDPSLLTVLANRFGRQCIVIAIDAARPLSPFPFPPEGERGASAEVMRDVVRWEVVTLSGKRRTGLDAVAWAGEAAVRGAGEILLTSWDRDGTRSGYDCELVAAVAGAVQVPVIASGGGETPEQMVAAIRAGAEAVLAASIFHDGDTTVEALKRRLSSLGVEVRL